MGNRMGLAAALFAAELVAVVLVFQVLSDFECRQTGVEQACRALRGGALRGLCIAAALGLVLALRADLRRDLAARVDAVPGHPGWALLHGLGLALIFLPWLATDAATHRAGFDLFLALLTGGAALAALGGLFWLMPPRDWSGWLRRGGALLAILVVAALIPDLADALGFAWQTDALLLSTFYGVAVLLSLAGQSVNLNLTPPTIGTGDFHVEVASSCSGIEGFALVAGFMAIYALLMQGNLRIGRYWLIVLPAALLVSWLFNLLRITGLILIGAHGSPALAVNGFHSFAGWLFFTLLALGILTVVQGLPALQRTGATGAAGAGQAAGAGAGAAEAPDAALTGDWAAARIVPFIVFMFSGLVVNAFWQAPALGFPLQAAMMAAALWLFRAPLLALDWRLDPVALLAGLAVGLGWIALAPAGAAPLQGLDRLGTGAFALWAAIRILGTSLLVPVVEEAFFRGYLLARLDTGSWQMRLSAIIISSLAFALLHGRILEAGIAGLVFAVVMLRRGRLGDAILAHATANAAVATAALLAGDWSLI
ncbi:exosortase E/protease, VPEID-CTERM system [Antarcticimicrobium luteum]|uniref:Exosortase E/protease, VPEID-CTERM system n=1 Tax=Antarcticimicrobium luteum TaxID=2547397 RepID=A0A4R5VDR7_9RHOB|nr:exosortase E/protease, VPEID-CTERM system [Antarcticimicrobium luteum]TDK50448.1 exosortase E/protease, VPEID-CTERM system [Antarcticimicrobium luteum]